MKRRFVNLVLGNFTGGSFTMHRIRSSSLFHPKKQHKGRPPLPLTSLLVEEAALPKPACTLRKEDGGEVLFTPFGSSRDKIASADEDGNVMVHDMCHNRFSSMPRLKGRWGNASSIAITLGDDLYLVVPHASADRFRPYQRPNFQALIHGEPPAGDFHGFRPPGWYWHSLPLPPFMETSGYEYEPNWGTKIVSSTVVGDSSIWVSASGGIGTYSFDKGSRQWRKVGSWELPFHGHAQYVPELDRWLGFSGEREDQFLCASDLSAAADADGDGAVVPTLCRVVWKEDDDVAATNYRHKSWVLLRSDLVRVDSGRFCVARLFHGYVRYPFYNKENFAVLMGVELERSDADGHSRGDGIQMVKHKSIRYSFDDRLLQLVC